MFKSIKATDIVLLESKEIYLSDLEDEELQNHFQISNFRLVTNKRSYGPFGCTDSLVRKPVTILIDKGDVIAQAVTSFIFPNDNDEPVYYSDSKCFSFYVSSQSQELKSIYNEISAKTKMHLLMLADTIE